MGIFTLFYIHTNWTALFIQLEFNFGCFKADCAVLEFTVSQLVSQSI